jgi:hypothetical protein
MVMPETPAPASAGVFYCLRRYRTAILIAIMCDAAVQLARDQEHDPEKWKPVFGKDHAQPNDRAPCAMPPCSWPATSSGLIMC